MCVVALHVLHSSLPVCVMRRLCYVQSLVCVYVQVIVTSLVAALRACLAWLASLNVAQRRSMWQCLICLVDANYTDNPSTPTL